MTFHLDFTGATFSGAVATGEGSVPISGTGEIRNLSFDSTRLMRTRLLTLLLILPVAGACGRNVEASSEPTPAAATAFDPSGLYDFTASLDGETRTGTLELERNAAGEWAGEAWLEGESDPAMVENVVIAGNNVTVYLLVNGMNDIQFNLDFAGSGFTGAIMAGDESIDVTGTRRVR